MSVHVEKLVNKATLSFDGIDCSWSWFINPYKVVFFNRGTAKIGLMGKYITEKVDVEITEEANAEITEETDAEQTGTRIKTRNILQKDTTTRIYFERSREGVYSFVDPRSKTTLSFQANPLTREMMVELGFKITEHRDGTESFDINEENVANYLFLTDKELLNCQNLVRVGNRGTIIKNDDITLPFTKKQSLVERACFQKIDKDDNKVHLFSAKLY